MKEIMMTLKACRVNANLRIKEVASIVGKTERTIKNWESGRSIPNGIDLKTLANLYHVSMDHIFLGNKLSLDEYYKKKH